MYQVFDSLPIDKFFQEVRAFTDPYFIAGLYQDIPTQVILMGGPQFFGLCEEVVKRRKQFQSIHLDYSSPKIPTMTLQLDTLTPRTVKVCTISLT